MKDPIYFVKARLLKPWFREPKVVYDIKVTYQYWDDPSYGNRGGDYRDAVKTLASVESKEEAYDLCKKLCENYQP
jgi:hypothetical protein